MTLPSPLHTPINYPQSPAERYVARQSDILFSGNAQLDRSPETPSSVAINTSQCLQLTMSHAEQMNQWYQKQTNDIYKKQKYRYAYGMHPSSSTTSPIGLGLTFPPSTKKVDIQPIKPRVKKCQSLPRSNSDESPDKSKSFSIV